MGQIVVTRSINNLMAAEQKFAVEVNIALQRFAVKDWGNLDNEDKQTNEDALNYPDDLYVMGAYETSKGKSGSSPIESPKRQEITPRQYVFPMNDKRKQCRNKRNSLKYGCP